MRGDERGRVSFRRCVFGLRILIRLEGNSVAIDWQTTTETSHSNTSIPNSRSLLVVLTTDSYRVFKSKIQGDNFTRDETAAELHFCRE